ncbi:MAG: DUF4886 domain-containing protein [Clostridia bacterium]|nr:DUF4886 domain-containing protein [Clostridia bacterium]
MRILAIGNSFSRDATTFLRQTLAASGVEAEVANLYIGGCSLEMHWQNVEKDARAYELQLNGVRTERSVSIREMLELCPWDFIVTQQASHDSGWEVTYEPFLSLLCDYLRKLQPGARLCLQQTWAYEPDSPHKHFMRYHRDQQRMYNALTRCYQDAALRHGLMLIPCGDVIQKLRQEAAFDPAQGGVSICRDGFHMHWLYGRYLLSLTWAKAMFGVKAAENCFVPHDPAQLMNADPALLSLVRRTVDAV